MDLDLDILSCLNGPKHTCLNEGGGCSSGLSVKCRAAPGFIVSIPASSSYVLVWECPSHVFAYGSMAVFIVLVNQVNTPYHTTLHVLYDYTLCLYDKSMECFKHDIKMVQDRPCLEWFRDAPSLSLSCVGVKCELCA